MSKNSSDKERQRIWGQVGSARELLRLQSAAGLLGRVVRLGVQQAGERPRHVQLIDQLMGRLAVLNQIEPAWSPAINELYSAVGGWHGTGRYQYRQGKPTDVFGLMLRAGHLAPHKDTFDVTRDPQQGAQIVAMARPRMYARGYADMHRHEPTEEGRHGTSLFWGGVFISDTVIEAILEVRGWTPTGYKRLVSHFGGGKLQNWCEKVTTDTRTNLINIYRKGSDIPGNYPILFGVKRGLLTPMATSRAISVYEDRTEETPTLQTHITHLEVPDANVRQTAEDLTAAGYALPVIPIEQAERHCASLPFSSLVIGQTAINDRL